MPAVTAEGKGRCLKMTEGSDAPASPRKSARRPRKARKESDIPLRLLNFEPKTAIATRPYGEAAIMRKTQSCYASSCHHATVYPIPYESP